MQGKFDFSVLMSVYKKENPEYFNIALDSVVKQTLMPNEIVIVKDGVLTDELEKIIQDYVLKYPDIFNVVSLEKNVGLGEALRNGILNCKNEIIARMDTDDIARKDRFEKQIKFLQENENIDVVGSYISEFEKTPENIISYRELPLEHKEIYKFAQFRCPLNHMTVMYKKEAVIKSGNYQKFKNIEDYYLWARMLKSDVVFANIPECLVNVRAGQAMFKRRSNLKYFFESEFPLHTKLYEIKFINTRQYLRNVISKFFLRILPCKAMGFVYKKFLRKQKEQC